MDAQSGNRSTRVRAQTRHEYLDDRDSEFEAGQVGAIDAVVPGTDEARANVPQILLQVAAAMIHNFVPGKIAAPSFEQSTEAPMRIVKFVRIAFQSFPRTMNEGQAALRCFGHHPQSGYGRV